MVTPAEHKRRDPSVLPSTTTLGCPVCGATEAQCLGRFDEAYLRLVADCGRCGTVYYIEIRCTPKRARVAR